MLSVARVHRALPIFRMDEGERVLFYTPGNVLATTPAAAALIQAALEEDGNTGVPDTDDRARRLAARGRAAVRAWREQAETPFEPECLTLYLSNRCNLACSYCYSAPADEPRARNRLRMYQERDPRFPILAEDAAYAAARLVARHCATKAKPLTLVLHGGGEPTVHWSLLERVHAEIDRIAQEHSIGFWSYIATHGVLAEDRARWLAHHFSLIGLSCDGPPDVQNANRPAASGASTSAFVERTARTFLEAGVAFSVRATITPATVRRQAEILLYAHDRLGARTVRFEPAYHGRHASGPHFRPKDAEEFVDHFLEACKLAGERGCDLRVSGVRVDEIHGPFCNPLRQVLQLTPDGAATACFLSTGSREPEDAALSLGWWDPSSGEFKIDYERAAALRRRAARVPERCESCVNVYHCARDCPDVCVITADVAQERKEGFRCRVQQLLARHWIRAMSLQ